MFILHTKRYEFLYMQMTVTWTSGYNIDEAVPLVAWGLTGEYQTLSPAGTLTFHRNSMCGMIPPSPSFDLLNKFYHSIYVHFLEFVQVVEKDN